MDSQDNVLSDRLQLLRRWLDTLELPPFSLTPASSDASFRRYFRLQLDGRSLIAMDAPPPQEDVRPFVGIARSLHEVGVHVPEILAHDPAQGFVLMSDLGIQLYLPNLNDQTAERLYGDALRALLVLQARGPGSYSLPPYDEALLRREIGLFDEWYLGRHLGMQLGETRRDALQGVYTKLVRNALEQPQVCVHRDYHSRNLLLMAHHNPGVLDFQDAVMGPVTYDPVSLLRDCYIAWPRQRVEAWALGYRELAQQAGILGEVEPQRFLRWFDWMGVQRHLKATGIFARLNHRDGKPGYLADIPRTLGYVREVSERYTELAPLRQLLSELESHAPDSREAQ